mgnify:FL=1|jgi:phage baseplate assembly protein W|tara:strand:- start:3 stop:494 length:492 start_codon:yes stop_codon:yes gene_type:complete
MINEPFQISPLDLDNNSAIGIAFPLLEGGSFKQTKTVAEQVKANIINVLLTEPGERVNQPDLGVGLKSLLFENITNANEIVPIIEEQLETYVPDIDLEDVLSEFIEDEHILQITLVYSLVISGLRDSIVVNMSNSSQGANYKSSAGGFTTGTDHYPHNINNNY